MGAPQVQPVESAGLLIRQSLWLGTNLQIPITSQVLGGKGGTRSSPITVYTHAPHISSPEFLLKLLVCSRRKLTFRFTRVTAECRQLEMTLFWTYQSTSCIWSNTLLITNNVTSCVCGFTAWTQMWILTSDFKKTMWKWLLIVCKTFL